MTKHPPSNIALLTLATANMLNLALPQRQFYPNADPYSDAQYARKVAWLGERIASLNADILAAQEVWDEAALRAVVKASGLHYQSVTVPGAENPSPGTGGAQNTPAVGFVSRLPLLQLHSLKDFPAEHAVDVPEIGRKATFERPPLHAVIQGPQGLHLHCITLHLKSKRPKFLQDANGKYLEDHENPRILARASMRSLIMRAAEVAALRSYICDILQHTREPLVIMGDMNDSPNSVTTQILAATSEVAYDRSARDTSLFNAYDIQGERRLKRDVAYSHVHQGMPEVLDQILVSEEFTHSSKHSMGDVLRVDYFNDHLHEGNDRSKSDHGFVRAVLRIYAEERTQAGAVAAL